MGLSAEFTVRLETMEPLEDYAVEINSTLAQIDLICVQSPTRGRPIGRVVFLIVTVTATVNQRGSSTVLITVVTASVHTAVVVVSIRWFPVTDR